MQAKIYNRWVLKNYYLCTVEGQFNTMLCSLELNKTHGMMDKSEIGGLEAGEAMYKNTSQSFI